MSICADLIELRRVHTNLILKLSMKFSPVLAIHSYSVIFNLTAIKRFFSFQQGGAHDSNSARYLFRVPMIHRFMTSHPVAELLLCFRAKHQDGRPMPFGFLVILTHRLTELCILNAENVEKVSSRPFKQIS